jgi:hypothetical protein
LIFLSGFAFYAVTQDVTQHYNNTISAMNDKDWNRNQEKIVIKQIAITSTNQLNVTVENDGSIQSHLIWLGIFNKTATPENQTYQALNEFVRPGETDNIVSNFAILAGNKYVIQLVTELGNVVESKFYPTSYVSCALTLVTAPPTAYQGNNVTVLLTVTLNDTVVDSIQSLTVTINATPTNLVQLVSNSSLSASGLMRGTSVFFWWIYNAANTGTVSFNATYLQAPAGMYALTNVNILASPGQGGSGSVSIIGVNGTAEYNPSQWTLLGSTQNVSGLVADLASNDSSYAVFRSYYAGTSADINHSVDDNSSNVDGFPNLGTHSNFTAQKYGPDLINDTLTEGSTGGATRDEYYNTGDDDDGGGAWASFKLCQTFNSSTSFSITSVKLLLYRTGSALPYATATVGIYATTGSPPYPNGSALTSASGITLTGTAAWYEITLAAYTLNAGTTYAIVISGSGGNSGNAVYWRCDTTSPTYANGMYGRSLSSGAWGTGQMNGAIDNMFEVWGTSYNYQLDIEERFTSVDTGAYTNKELCVFAGTWSTSETLKVDVWNTTSSSWVNVIPSLTKNAWNNVSIANLLTANVTIRFQGGAETSDTVQDSWNIDVTLLHVWSNGYTSEVEFTGSSNLQAWTSLLWQIQSCWNISQVTVTIQFYNFTLGNYVSSGTGYVSYVSNAIPNTNELCSQTEPLSPNDFKNSTGYWRVKIKGVKSNSTQFLMKVDWIDLQIAYSTTGDTIPHSAWELYSLKATTASGDSIPYAYVSIYANGTLVYFRNATDKVDIGNPAWVRLNAGGQYLLEVKSASGSAETFVLYAVVGSIVGQKTVTQEAPP